MAAVSVLADGSATTALRLGLAMFLLQASIGTLNDLVDAPIDAGRKPGKPIPAGLVGRSTARVVAVAAAVLGLVLAAPSGLATVVLAVAVLGIGYGYDTIAKGTAWSWLPFAVGIPLLPVFGWLGTTGTLPSSFAILIPAAILAGTALAIANARADAERDLAAGIESVATQLGPRRSWVVATALLGVVVAAAVATILAWDGPVVALLGAAAATGVIGAGMLLGRSRDPARLERAWELEAVGVALLAAAWLAGTLPAG